MTWKGWNIFKSSGDSISTETVERQEKIERAAKDFAVRFEDVMKDLSRG